ncbi:MAG: HAD family hydrolase [Chloroflexi bacterium]|nr:HAD family hydrolase [Chloroflexota bacterium]
MSKAILFDLDDTLLDREGSIEPIASHQYQQYGLQHIPFEAYLARFRELDEHGYAERHQLFRTLVAEFDISADSEEMLWDYRRQTWQVAQLFDDALPVLEAFRQRGYQLGIITNGSTAMQTGKLEATGLLKLVDVALISEQVGLHKPDPLIFQQAAEKLAISPEQCIFVGDHPVRDVMGAHRVGMTAIWRVAHLAWPDDLAIKPHHTIHQLSDLLRLPL